MKLLAYVERIFAAASGSDAVGGRRVILEKSSAVRQALSAKSVGGTDVRVVIAAKWSMPSFPIVVWLRPSSSQPESIEALSWALAHLALGHLETSEEHVLTSAALRSDYVLPLKVAGRDLIEQTKKDLSLRAFVWAAYFLVGPQKQFLISAERAASHAPDDVRALAGTLQVPERIVRIWQDCQLLPSGDAEDLIGSPRDWAEMVLRNPGPPPETRSELTGLEAPSETAGTLLALLESEQEEHQVG